MTADRAPEGPAAFALAAVICGVPVQPDELTHRFAVGGQFGAPEMLRAAKALGLHAKVVSPSLRRLTAMPMPAIARDKAGGFLVVGRVAADDDGEVRRLMIQRPGGPPRPITAEDFVAIWDGVLVARFV